MKGIWHKNGGDNKGASIGNPSKLASSWIVSVDASIRMTCSQQNARNMARFQPLSDGIILDPLVQGT